jgi:hypothetical protein
MRDLLKPERISVSCEGELVVFQVGNSVMKFEYETAIQLSTWLRVRGKEAKRNAGDHSRHWSVIGNLKDVMNGGRPWGRG